METSNERWKVGQRRRVTVMDVGYDGDAPSHEGVLVARKESPDKWYRDQEKYDFVLVCSGSGVRDSVIGAHSSWPSTLLATPSSPLYQGVPNNHPDRAMAAEPSCSDGLCGASDCQSCGPKQFPACRRCNDSGEIAIGNDPGGGPMAWKPCPNCKSSACDRHEKYDDTCSGCDLATVFPRPATAAPPACTETRSHIAGPGCNHAAKPVPALPSIRREAPPLREVSTDAGKTWINYARIGDPDPFEAYAWRREASAFTVTGWLVTSPVEPRGYHGKTFADHVRTDVDQAAGMAALDESNRLHTERTRVPAAAPVGPVVQARTHDFVGVWNLRAK